MNRIVFMGTPDFAVPCLQLLIKRGLVVGVVTQPDKPAGRGQKLRPSPVKEAAVTANLPIYQPTTLKPEETAAPIRAWQPDLIVVAAYGQILRPHLLNMPRLGCVNIHASLLPRWRGASPIQHAILAGDADTGVTLMQMDVGLDTGDMLAKQTVSITPTDTAQTLHDKLAEAGATLLDNALADLLAEKLPPTPQDDALSTYAPLIKKSDGLLDWTRTSAELDRLVRAMTPWPSAFTHWNGTALKVLEQRPYPLVPALENCPVGQVVAVGNDVVVRTADAGMVLLRVQLAGKRAADIADFVRGRPTFTEAQLGNPPTTT